MSCHRLPAGGILCLRRSAPPKCQMAGCGLVAVAECDHQVGAFSAGTPSTCDRRICERHRTRAAGLDLCPFHQSAPRQGNLFSRRASEKV